MSYSKISILLPTRKRIEYLKRMLKSYQDTLVNPEQSEFVFRIDSDDIESAEFLAPYGWPVIIGPRREGYKSLPAFYNEMVKLATGDLFICGNDDMLFQTPNWPRLVIEEADKYPDGIFNIGVSTGLNEDKFPFSIVSRQLVDRLGKINDERLLFSDVFLLDVARHFNRSIGLRTVTFRHDWAGHTDDQTRREANQHEFSQVFANVHGDWSEEYRQLHFAVVREAINKLDPRVDHAINKALQEYDAYHPTAAIDGKWPPRVAPNGWGRGDSANSIHYGQQETRSLLRTLLESGIFRDEAIVSSLGNGLPSVLWATLFRHVTTIVDQPSEGDIVDSGRHTLAHGHIGNTRFLHKLAERAGRINLQVLDGPRYSELISPYYVFRKFMARPGMIVFANAGGGNAVGPGMPRFVADLRSGELDGIRHDIVDVIPRDGSGFAFEILN